MQKGNWQGYITFLLDTVLKNTRQKLNRKLSTNVVDKCQNSIKRVQETGQENGYKYR